MNNSVHPLFQGIINAIAPLNYCPKCKYLDRPDYNCDLCNGIGYIDSYCPICKCGDRESHKIEVCKFCKEKFKAEKDGK